MCWVIQSCQIKTGKKKLLRRISWRKTTSNMKLLLKPVSYLCLETTALNDGYNSSESINDGINYSTDHVWPKPATHWRVVRTALSNFPPVLHASALRLHHSKHCLLRCMTSMNFSHLPVGSRQGVIVVRTCGPCYQGKYITARLTGRKQTYREGSVGFC